MARQINIMEEHVKKIQSKPEHIRKQYLWFYVIIIMVIVFGIFVLSFKNRYNKKVVEQTKEDIKPLQLFGNSLKNTFSNLTAGVGNAKTESIPETPKSQKMIELIPINK